MNPITTETMPEGGSNRPFHGTLGAIFGYTASLARTNTPKRTILFFFRSLYHFGLTGRWMTFIEDFGVRHDLGSAPLDLVRKAFGAYFTMNRSLGEREALLEQHYVWAGRLLPRRTLEALWHGRETELGRIPGKKDDYVVTLNRADRCGCRHEGEWTAGFLAASSGALLCRITLLLVLCPDGEPGIAVGGLQGPARDIAKQSLVTATRDLGGLRPKDAMLLIAAGMARSLGRETLFAVGNADHPINYRGRRRRAKMLTDYDGYWRERGGVPGGPFGYILPAKDPSEAEPGNRRRDDAKKAFFDVGYRVVEPKVLPQPAEPVAVGA